MMTDETLLLRRFLRTVRVATATALAGYEISRASTAAAPVVFHALAAKSADGWRFPEAGLAAADGLLLATVDRNDAGIPVRLVLQAQGVAGLDQWAGRSAALSFGPVGPDASTTFDAAGRGAIDLVGLDLDEDDLMHFDLRATDGSN